MLNQTQVAERLSSCYEKKKNPNRQPTIRKWQEGERKQIYKQIHNVRKQLKPENQETGVENSEYAVLV